MTRPPEAFFRRWVHVREEDDAEVRVYRPADRPLPPARGREAIEFRPDGTCLHYRPGPADAPAGTSGHWQAAPDHRLQVTDATGAATTFTVVEATDDILRLRLLS